MMIYIFIGSNSIGQKGGKALAHALSQMKSLKEFNISNYLHFILINAGNNEIGSKGAEAIAASLREMKLLDVLNIGNCLHLI